VPQKSIAIISPDKVVYFGAKCNMHN